MQNLSHGGLNIEKYQLYYLPMRLVTKSSSDWFNLVPDTCHRRIHTNSGSILLLYHCNGFLSPVTPLSVDKNRSTLTLVSCLYQAYLSLGDLDWLVVWLSKQEVTRSWQIVDWYYDVTESDRVLWLYRKWLSIFQMTLDDLESQILWYSS